MNELPEIITIGEAYGPAMKITDPEEAKAYFEMLVSHNMKYQHNNRTRAEQIERQNLGYFAGYCSNETRARVEKLFNCVHQIFGPISKHIPTAEEALNIGKALAEAEKQE